ncbi:hypothetical protein AB0B31_41580 [Catellatospora citrea]|uniref:hypothetical protein n=1 Tax=Catellatospora citrea TaxID=53366 RepID=UPI0033C51D61
MAHPVLRRGLSLAAVALTAAAGVALGAAPAAAAVPSKDAEVYTLDDNPGGRGFFESTGEHLFACDQQADGLRVVARITWYGGGAYHTRTVHDADGANNGCTEYANDIEIAEGTEVILEVWLQDGADGTPRFRNLKSGWA